MNQTMIELIDISYTYYDQVQALNHLSVKISEGEKVAVIGANGSGKSTFFRCLNGLLIPQSGDFLFAGEPTNRGGKKSRQWQRQVGYVFQDPDHQIIAASVEGEISFGLMNMGMKREEVKQRVEQMMEHFDLLRYRGKAPHYLSGGEKRRVCIAAVLVMQPTVLLLDEPTAYLDGTSSDQLELFLNQPPLSELTMLLSTHDMDFVWRWAERVLVLEKGALIGDGTPDQIFGNHQLIKKTQMKPPMLYELTERWCQRKGILKPAIMPRTPAEFDAWAASL